MNNIISALESTGFSTETFLKSAAILVIGTLLLGFIGRFVFGKRSSVNHAVSSAIGILFLYALTIVLYSAGAQYHALIAPLPFVGFLGDQLTIFTFAGAHYATVCSEVLSMIILAFLVNLLDVWLPRGKKLLGWLFYRILTVVLALVLHLIVTYLFTTYLPPEGIVTYAPTVLLWLLLIMLAVGALKIVVGALLSTVNPIIGGLYTFFFATLIGKQLSKAVLTTVLLTAIVYALNYFGLTVISIATAALIAYIPLLIILVLIWYLVNRVL